MAMCPLVQASIDIEDEIFYYKYRSEIDVNNSNNQHIGNHQENIERVKAIFTRNEIYFPNRKELNDCEDCNPIFSLKATRKDWKNSFARSIKRDAKRKGQNINKHQCLKRAEQFVQTGAYKQPENRSKLINALRNEIATIGIYSLSEILSRMPVVTLTLFQLINPGNYVHIYLVNTERNSFRNALNLSCRLFISSLNRLGTSSTEFTDWRSKQSMSPFKSRVPLVILKSRG